MTGIWLVLIFLFSFKGEVILNKPWTILWIAIPLLIQTVFIFALGYAAAVKSPTYALVETYDTDQWRIAHLDLYRLQDPDELQSIGFRDIAADSDLLLIEWPERAATELPDVDLAIIIRYSGAGRSVRLVGCVSGFSQ